MAWRRTGDKPLSEPMLTQFTDAFMRHQGRWVNMCLKGITFDYQSCSLIWHDIMYNSSLMWDVLSYFTNGTWVVKQICPPLTLHHKDFVWIKPRISNHWWCSSAECAHYRSSFLSQPVYVILHALWVICDNATYTKIWHWTHERWPIGHPWRLVIRGSLMSIVNEIYCV